MAKSKSAAKLRSTWVTFTLTPAEKKRVMQLAEKAGMPTSSYVRFKLLGKGVAASGDDSEASADT